MEKTFMFTVCCYCHKIIRFEMVEVNRCKIDNDRGFTVSHGACIKCHDEILGQIRSGTYN